MQKVKIGLYEPSKIAYGCMRIGKKSESEAIRAVKTALDCSVNFFDNADIYCAGKSEEYFGKAIKGTDRDSIVIQTKCSIRKGFYDFSKEYIISSLEGSLKRMNVDYADILCLHRPDVLLDGEEVAAAFENLHSRGLVKQFGVSNFTPMQIELIKKYTSLEITVNQLQLGIFHTGMIDSWICANMDNDFAVDKDGGVLAYSMLNDIVIQAWGPMRSKNGFFPESPELKDNLSAMKVYAEKYSLSIEALAVAWLNRLKIVQPIIGTTDEKRIRGIMKCGDVKISREDWYAVYKAAGNIVP